MKKKFSTKSLLSRQEMQSLKGGFFPISQCGVCKSDQTIGCVASNTALRICGCPADNPFMSLGCGPATEIGV